MQTVIIAQHAQVIWGYFLENILSAQTNFTSLKALATSLFPSLDQFTDLTSFVQNILFIQNIF